MLKARGHPAERSLSEAPVAAHFGRSMRTNAVEHVVAMVSAVALVAVAAVVVLRAPLAQGAARHAGRPHTPGVVERAQTTACSARCAAGLEACLARCALR